MEKTKCLLFTSLFGFLLVSTGLAVTAMAQTADGLTQTQFDYTELLPPPGWNWSVPYNVNNCNSMIGQGWKTGAINNPHSFLNSGGSFTEIEFPGWDSTWTADINNYNDVVGSGYTGFPGGTNKGFIYSGGSYADLLSPGLSCVFAHGINDKGDVVGYDEGCLSGKGFIYSGGSYTDLLPPSPYKFEGAYGPIDINNNSDVVGSMYALGPRHRGFIYSGGSYTEILPPPGWDAVGLGGINDSGDVIGEMRNYGEADDGSFLLSDGVYTELTPPGLTRVRATAINNRGDVVGSGLDSNGNRTAFLYSGGSYTEILPPGSIEASAWDINDNRVIVGWYKDSTSYYNGYIATPVVTKIMSSIEINPNTIILNSKGNFITVYVELPTGYDIGDINITTVAVTKINDDLICPSMHTVGPFEIGDYDGDSIPELMVKFDRQELIPLLDINDNEVTVEGELTNGSQFEGTDKIRVTGDKQRE